MFVLFRHAPTHLASFIASLSEKKFHPEGKKFPQLKARAVQVRAMTEPVFRLWCAVGDMSVRRELLLKIALERSLKFDEIMMAHAGPPCLPDQAHWVHCEMVNESRASLFGCRNICFQYAWTAGSP